MIPLRLWAQQWWQREPGHILAPADVAYRAPGPSDLGATGPFLQWIMETHVGVGSAYGSLPAPWSHYFDQLTPAAAQQYLLMVNAKLAAALARHVGTPIGQLPASLTITGLAPVTPPTGLADPAKDLADALIGAVQALLAGLAEGLAPLIIGAIFLIAILVLIYLGVKRTLL